MAARPARVTLNVELIERLRGERKWSRAELARQLELDPSTVTYWLKDGSIEPSGAAVVRLQALFPEHRDELFIDRRNVTVTTTVAVNAGDAIGA